MKFCIINLLVLVLVANALGQGYPAWLGEAIRNPPPVTQSQIQSLQYTINTMKQEQQKMNENFVETMAKMQKQIDELEKKSSPATNYNVPEELKTIIQTQIDRLQDGIAKLKDQIESATGWAKERLESKLAALVKLVETLRSRIADTESEDVVNYASETRAQKIRRLRQEIKDVEDKLKTANGESKEESSSKLEDLESQLERVLTDFGFHIPTGSTPVPVTMYQVKDTVQKIDAAIRRTIEEMNNTPLKEALQRKLDALESVKRRVIERFGDNN